MGIALLSLSGLFQGFAALQRLTATAPTPQPRPLRALRMVRPTGARAPVSARPVSSIGPVGTPRPCALRVLRVCDAQPTAGDAGRMVISGRMADVCAELDRLAAREAAATRH